MKIFNKNLKKTLTEPMPYYEGLRYQIIALGMVPILGIGLSALAIFCDEYASDNNNEDIVAEETNIQDNIYNIKLADETIVSFTQEEYEGFREYLNSIKPQEEKTYKLTR